MIKPTCYVFENLNVLPDASGRQDKYLNVPAAHFDIKYYLVSDYDTIAVRDRIKSTDLVVCVYYSPSFGVRDQKFIIPIRNAQLWDQKLIFAFVGRADQEHALPGFLYNHWRFFKLLKQKRVLIWYGPLGKLGEVVSINLEYLRTREVEQQTRIKKWSLQEIQNLVEYSEIFQKMVEISFPKLDDTKDEIKKLLKKIQISVQNLSYPNNRNLLTREHGKKKILLESKIQYNYLKGKASQLIQSTANLEDLAEMAQAPIILRQEIQMYLPELREKRLAFQKQIEESYKSNQESIRPIQSEHEDLKKTVMTCRRIQIQFSDYKDTLKSMFEKFEQKAKNLKERRKSKDILKQIKDLEQLIEQRKKKNQRIKQLEDNKNSIKQALINDFKVLQSILLNKCKQITAFKIQNIGDQLSDSQRRQIFAEIKMSEEQQQLPKTQIVPILQKFLSTANRSHSFRQKYGLLIGKVSRLLNSVKFEIRKDLIEKLHTCDEFKEIKQLTMLLEKILVTPFHQNMEPCFAAIYVPALIKGQDQEKIIDQLKKNLTLYKIQHDDLQKSLMQSMMSGAPQQTLARMNQKYSILNHFESQIAALRQGREQGILKFYKLLVLDQHWPGDRRDAATENEVIKKVSELHRHSENQSAASQQSQGQEERSKILDILIPSMLGLFAELKLQDKAAKELTQINQLKERLKQLDGFQAKQKFEVQIQRKTRQYKQLMLHDQFMSKVLLERHGRTYKHCNFLESVDSIIRNCKKTQQHSQKLCKKYEKICLLQKYREPDLAIIQPPYNQEKWFKTLTFMVRQRALEPGCKTKITQRMEEELKDVPAQAQQIQDQIIAVLKLQTELIAEFKALTNQESILLEEAPKRKAQVWSSLTEIHKHISE